MGDFLREAVRKYATRKYETLASLCAEPLLAVVRFSVQTPLTPDCMQLITQLIVKQPLCVFEMYAAQVHVLVHARWQLPEITQDASEKLKGVDELRWDSAYTQVKPLPTMRVIEYRGQRGFVDDIRLAKLIRRHVSSLPLFMYTDVKKFTYSYLPDTFDELFGTESSFNANTWPPRKCVICGVTSTSVRLRYSYAVGHPRSMCKNCEGPSPKARVTEKAVEECATPEYESSRQSKKRPIEQSRGDMSDGAVSGIKKHPAKK